MLIALLAVLGVDLIVIVVLLGGVLLRRRWVSRQPGAFKGAIRVVDGEVPRLAGKWRRGYGRWVRDVLMWEKPPLFRGVPVPVLSLAGLGRVAETGEVKRLGKQVGILSVTVEGGALIEIAAAEGERELAQGPFAVPGTEPGAA
jgi:hypothetical protein